VANGCGLRSPKAFRKASAAVILMATPQVPDGRCRHCGAPVIDLFAEWTDEYQTPDGKQAILRGEIVFDCYYCQRAIQLQLPLALILPDRGPTEYRVAKRRKSRCEEWLRSQHPGQTLSQVVEAADWSHGGKWAFDGYNWAEGEVHRHGQDRPPAP
jgi:hypothetical protein